MSLIGLNDKKAGAGTWTQYGWRAGPIPEPGSESIPVTRNGLGLPSSCEASYTMNPGVQAYVCPAYLPNPTNAASKRVPFWVPLTTTNDPTYAAMRSYKPTYRPTVVDSLSGADERSPDVGAVQLKYPSLLAVEWVNFLEADQEMWLTVFGYDYYGFPIQEMILLEYAAPGGQVITTFSGKAFYGVTAAFLNEIPAGLNWTDFAIDIISTYIYQFPYCVFDRTISEDPGLGQMLQITDSSGNTQADYTITAANGGAPSLTSTDARGVFTLTTPPEGPPTWITVKYQVFSASPELARMEKELSGGNPGGVKFTPDSPFSTYGLDDTYGKLPFYLGYVTTADQL